jgi:hypothetical protein
MIHFLLLVGVAGGSVIGLVMIREWVRNGFIIDIGKGIWLLALVAFFYVNKRAGLWEIAWDFADSGGWNMVLLCAGGGVFFMSMIQMEEVQLRWIAKQQAALDPEVQAMRETVEQMKIKMRELR